jgi:hypothetical protein
MAKKYRVKNQYVTAVCYDGWTSSIADFVGEHLVVTRREEYGACFLCQRAQVMIVGIGDYIIKTDQGLLRVMDPATFYETYSEVLDD